MWKRYVVGVAVYGVFFAAVILGTTGAATKAAGLIIITVAALFWLGFSVYRITVWIRDRDKGEKRTKAIANYPHWFNRFALDEPDDDPDRPVTVSQIDTI